MTFKHCTIDLETMDNRPTSAITSIACVMFNVDDEATAEFKVNVDLQSSVDLGLTLSGETIMWWMKQDKPAQLGLFTPKPIDAKLALLMLKEFIKSHRANGFTCWTHATFDAPILNYAFRLIGANSPIHYREHRDIRTLTWLARGKIMGERKKPDVAHDSLSDARNQADYIRDHLRFFNMGAVEDANETPAETE